MATITRTVNVALANGLRRQLHMGDRVEVMKPSGRYDYIARPEGNLGNGEFFVIKAVYVNPDPGEVYFLGKKGRIEERWRKAMSHMGAEDINMATRQADVSVRKKDITELSIHD